MKISSIGSLLWLGIWLIVVTLYLYPDVSSVNVLGQAIALGICVSYFVVLGLLLRRSLAHEDVCFYEVKARLMFHPLAVPVLFILAFLIIKELG